MLKSNRLRAELARLEAALRDESRSQSPEPERLYTLRARRAYLHEALWSAEVAGWAQRRSSVLS